MQINIESISEDGKAYQTYIMIYFCQFIVLIFNNASRKIVLLSEIRKIAELCEKMDEITPEKLPFLSICAPYCLETLMTLINTVNVSKF